MQAQGNFILHAAMIFANIGFINLEVSQEQ
jgi:hypothetical protein